MKILSSILPRALHKRIQLTMWGLIFVIAIAQFLLFAFYMQRGSDTIRQSANWGLAQEIADQLFESLQANPVNLAAARHRLFEITRLNPDIDPFILDKRGRVIAYVSEAPMPVTPQGLALELYPVNLAPIEAFLNFQFSRNLPLLAESPRDRSDAIFSAARISLGSEDGFLYVILRSNISGHQIGGIRDVLLIKASLMTSVFLALLTGLSGALILLAITKRFRQLSAIVHQFAAGDLSGRYRGKSGDEIDVLGSEFNQMADTIQRSIAELKHTDQLRRDLVADVSHELGGPLLLVGGYLELLENEQQSLTAEEKREFLGRSSRNIKLLYRLAKEMLDLAQLEAADTKPVKELFCLADLLTDDLLPRIQPLADQKQTTLAFENLSGAVFVDADPALIERTIFNLVENAIKYGKIAGTVQVRLVRQSDILTIEISDDGPGIPADELPYIFDRFYRAAAHRDTARGTGLGLAIARKVAEIHGGTLTVSSKVGSGSTFRLEIPCQSDRLGL